MRLSPTEGETELLMFVSAAVHTVYSSPREEECGSFSGWKWEEVGAVRIIEVIEISKKYNAVQLPK